MAAQSLNKTQLRCHDRCLKVTGHLVGRREEGAQTARILPQRLVLVKLFQSLSLSCRHFHAAQMGIKHYMKHAAFHIHQVRTWCI